MKREDVPKTALANYSTSGPWPEHDIWHSYTFSSVKRIVEHWLADYAKEDMRVLNAGSGGTEYESCGEMIHLDIIENYIRHFDNHLVGSIEDISIPDLSVDGIVCVGSVLNYTDAQRSISELSRILKPGGFLILEFERSESAEFLLTPQYGKYIFLKEYLYNHQKHLLWMYSEKHIRQLLKHYGVQIRKFKRIHSISSLLYRLGLSEETAALYSKYDAMVKLLSYPIAHNVILLGTKNIFAKGNN